MSYDDAGVTAWAGSLPRWVAPVNRPETLAQTPPGPTDFPQSGENKEKAQEKCPFKVTHVNMKTPCQSGRWCGENQQIFGGRGFKYIPILVLKFNFVG